ncbi:MAG: sulfatase-like hydrolase/transferase [Armatimonadota bacterium]
MLALLFLIPLLAARAQEKQEKPNILFLLSDDHSYPYLSCYGDTNVTTPHLDRLAAEGMKFHRFFTAAPQCVPSRAALLTGRSPVAARITRFSSPLPRDVETFPERLRREAGYFVGVCGRTYHLDGYNLGGFVEKNNLKTFPERFDYVRTGSDTAAITQMDEFLKQKPRDKPFCLWVNFSDPHHPWNAPAAFRPDPVSLKLPPHFPDLPGVRSQLADHCAEVNRVDATVGKVLTLLKEKGLEKNTIVVFCGDNGQALPHGKGSLYDPGLNVPFLVRWPGVVGPGGESHALLLGEDLAPTLLGAVGVTASAQSSGLSFLPLLKGESFTPRRQIFAERGPHGSAPVTVGMKSSGYDLARCVRTERYKLIYNATPWIPYGPVDSAGGAAWKEIEQSHSSGALAPVLSATYFTTPRPVYELYDLAADPSELSNLSGRPEVARVEQELRLALAEKMTVDFDYLPLPNLTDLSVSATGKTESRPANRASQFTRLDTDKDGKLSKTEFSNGREPEEAHRWFRERDTNSDGFISREEYIPALPLPRLEKQ